ncbi:Fe-S cluster assembly protein SufD [Thermoanaerobacterium sp. CMT5567-10]|uniref:Fe-S cluster assembly protein SufD n=1 Tax=Thermoanaerobacterium sp. CMT5567-10 TaxID=3061989 RepID=UPI0026DF74E3|nr:Fe-S cluster assembly protein SufD [Thermoanaerobacterium sp. CMT5567-10]WKV07488.1 Fe-S cluster assembly protein SufD [Thermoanaerobacterium sp. CMT5567-10]
MIKSLDYNTIQELIKSSGSEEKELRVKGYEVFSKVPMPMWKRVKLDDVHIPYYKEYKSAIIKNEEQDGLVTNLITKALMDDDLNSLNTALKRNFGVDDKFKNMVLAFYNTGFSIRALPNSNIKLPIAVNYAVNGDDDTIIDLNLIIAERASNMTVVFDYSSEKRGFHNGLTVVIAKDGSNVNIVKIQRLSDDSSNFDNNIIITGNDASVRWTQVDLGSRVDAYDITAELEGTGSSAYLNSIFLGTKNQSHDMSYKVNHIAPRTESNVDVKGALKDTSKAVFRGNLDMKRGAKKAKGNESEVVLLLDKTVRSDAIPALWCSEDDVQANHSASAGQIDENKLYYMMSRGLSIDEAKLLMVEASFNPVIDTLPSDTMRESIRDYIGRRISG